MTDSDAGIRVTLTEGGLLRPGTGLAVGWHSPATGSLTWSSGSVEGRPVSASTPVYAASVTKQLVGVLTAQQVLAGRLDVDASVADLLPGPAGWLAPVRVRHLLAHTSGLPGTGRVLAALGLRSASELSNPLVLEGLRRLPGPDDQPGRAYAYSNVGYVVLAEVVRAVAGVELSDLARTSVFEPLQMTTSRLGDPLAPAAGWPAVPRTLGDGGWWTSAADLLRWLVALDHEELGPEVSRLVQTPGRLDDGTPLAYAWGVTARPGPAGTSYTHGGSWPGWSSKTVRRPATGTAVALLTTGADDEAVSRAALELHDRLPHP